MKEIYFKSVGNGASWNLNVPPDRTGQINSHDIKALDSLQDYLTKSFSTDLLHGAKVTASETRGNIKKYAASNVISDSKNLYWAVNDTTTTASLTFQLQKRSTFNCMEIKEFIPLGQRIRSFTIEVENDGKWIPVFKGSTVGSKKMAKFEDITASKVRITFSNALACPAIESVKLYKVL
ncbi:MAG: discoidin domain-containing protein [Ginsengibacter sp.]